MRKVNSKTIQGFIEFVFGLLKSQNMETLKAQYQQRVAIYLILYELEFIEICNIRYEDLREKGHVEWSHILG